jgi:phage tail sheath protein FI
MTNRGLVTGATVQSYIKAIGIVSDVNEVSMQLLTVPGIRERYITDSAITAVEQDRFDCFYIMDIEQFGPLGASQPLTGSYTNVSVTQTAADFSARGVNSSFAAAYFPDVNIRLDNGVVYDKMPPSVVVLGAYGNNDAIGQVFNAPAGYGRGTLRNVTDFAAVIDKPNADTLYLVNINPLLSKTGVGPVVWGQKTTLTKESLLNRVNVRRLLIAIRREVRKVGNQFLFEPAREETLKSFNAAVQPIMQRYQAAGGVSKYKVAIDTSTTSQADLDNKTIRGKVFLIPTTSLEFLSIDFIVSNRNNSVGG